MQRVSTARRGSQVFPVGEYPLPPNPDAGVSSGRTQAVRNCRASYSVLMAGAVWILAAGSTTSPANNRHLPPCSPEFFSLPVSASAAVTVTTGPPPTSAAAWVATQTEQHVRYVGLLVAGLLALAGFGLLTARLREAGERVFSVLGFSAYMIATGLFVLFTLGALTIYDLVAQQASAGNMPAWTSPLQILISSCSSYTRCSVTWRPACMPWPWARLDGWRSSAAPLRLPAGLGAIAAVSALIAIITPNGTGTLTHGLFVFLIPAVPLILPYLLGVNLVRRSVTRLKSMRVSG